MDKIKVRQVRSLIKRSKRQKRTMQALGLGHIGKIVLLMATPQLMGMLKKVNDLVTVEHI